MRKALLIGWITLVTTTVVGGGTGPGAPRAAERFSGAITGGAGSERELIDELLQALQQKDRDALRRLRVTEAEYENVIVPGHVPPGDRPRSLTPEWRDYAWRNLETRSHYHELRLLEEFGGRTLAVKDVQFEQGEERYGGYTAHKQLRLKVQDGDGTERELRTGSIAEVAGQYKFISFIRD